MSDRIFRGTSTAIALSLLVSASACGQAATPVRALPDRVENFGALVTQLSDAGGYFDTDNLISNELGYQQVLGTMERLKVTGGAYIGVGPDQNFTYIARIRPAIAFVADIRRDNMLQHVMYKALFALSSTRAQYLALWTGKPPSADTLARTNRNIVSLVAWIDSSATTPPSARRARFLVDSVVRHDPYIAQLKLTANDSATIARFHSAFIVDGLSLRFHSAGRAPQAHHPTLRQLLLEHDENGTMRSYLASEEDFQFVKSLQQRNLVVPVTGDLAGTSTLPGIAKYLSAHNTQVSALYVSNVEDYLFRGGTFPRYVESVKLLPHTDNTVIIRSFFGGGFGHPEATPDYYATQLLQRMNAFVMDDGLARVQRYRDLVNRDWISTRVP